MTVLEFLAKWKYTKAEWHLTSSGFIRCSRRLCPLQVITGARRGYIDMAEKTFGLRQDIALLIMNAADNVGGKGTLSYKLREAMLAAKRL